MKLFLVDVVTKKDLLEVLVHAEDAAAARAHLRTKFVGCELQNCNELEDAPKHFVVSETPKT